MTSCGAKSCRADERRFTASRRNFLKVGALAGSLLFFPTPLLGSILSDERTAWYRDAKFGMFIHWGPYSLASVEASWPIMTPKPGGITEAEYVDLPKRFNAEKFDARAFVELARSAGQRGSIAATAARGLDSTQVAAGASTSGRTPGAGPASASQRCGGRR